MTPACSNVLHQSTFNWDEDRAVPKQWRSAPSKISTCEKGKIEAERSTVVLYLQIGN